MATSKTSKSKPKKRKKKQATTPEIVPLPPGLAVPETGGGLGFLNK